MSSSDTPEPAPPTGQLLIYQAGSLKLQVRMDGQTVWLTQAGMADRLRRQNVTHGTDNPISIRLCRRFGVDVQSEQAGGTPGISECLRNHERCFCRQSVRDG